MRKSVLIKRTVELVDALNSLQQQLNGLKRENAELKEKIAELQSKKAAEPTVNTEPETAEGFTVCTDELEDERVITEHIELKEGNEVLEYGAVAIGRVVQESVKYANLISESDSENKKELLNLIMGKAEITKAEIFSITDGELAFDVQKELIDSQCDEAIDYFKSAYGQITE